MHAPKSIVIHTRSLYATTLDQAATDKTENRVRVGVQTSRHLRPSMVSKGTGTMLKYNWSLSEQRGVVFQI